MSCIECEENPILGACYRWKNANIQIIGCKKHLNEIMEALNKIQFQVEVVLPKIDKKHLDRDKNSKPVMFDSTFYEQTQ